jgi:biopolymer transport protein ExbB
MNSFSELISAGGPVVIILGVMSVLAMTVVFAKLQQFARMRIGNRKAAREALQMYKSGKVQEALDMAACSNGPVACVLAMAVRGQSAGLEENKVREEVLRFGGDILESLRNGFRILEVIASLAPLLGLLGTVIGMVEAFKALEAAGSQVNPAILSGGIWQALLTTAVGLTVAIPVVAILNWLEHLVDSLAHEMDNIVTQVFTVDLSAEPENKPQQRKEGAHDSIRLHTAPAAR